MILGFAIVVLMLFVLRYIRALHIRKKFLKRLYMVCNGKGCEVSHKKHLFSSLFSIFHGENFRIIIGSECFSCKFITAVKYSTPLVLNKEGIGRFIRTFKFFKFKVFQYDKTFRFGYESECKKILIINPTPEKIYGIREKQLRALDNGDSVGDYSIYTATAFLNALDRDCLGRS